MATKKPAKATVVTEVLDFDLATFKRQKEQLVRVAHQQVADKIVEIKGMIDEIGTLVELSGINIKLNQELRYAIEVVDEMNPEWNSSSYDC